MTSPIYCVDCHKRVEALYSRDSRIVGACNCEASGNYVERMRGPLREGRIYCIGEEGDSRFVKIGFTLAMPHQRLKELQVGNPRQLRLIGFIYGDMSLETALHESFKDYQFREEWFANEGLVKVFSESLASIVSEPLGQYTPKDMGKEIRLEKRKNRIDGPWLALGMSHSTYYRKGFRSNRKRGRKPCALGSMV